MRMMHHLAYMALRMSLYPVLTIAYQVGRFAFLVQIGFDMTFLFVFENFIDGDQDAGSLILPELMVDSGAEYTHFRGEAHISIDQRRHIDAELADFLVQDLVIVLEVVILEKLLHFFWIRACFQWADRSDQFLRVGEVHVQKIQDHVAGFGIIGVIHRYLPEVILQAGVHHGKSSRPSQRLSNTNNLFALPLRVDWYSSVTNERPSSTVYGKYSLLNLSEKLKRWEVAKTGLPALSNFTSEPQRKR